jgi:hypothetical protein
VGVVRRAHCERSSRWYLAPYRVNPMFPNHVTKRETRRSPMTLKILHTADIHLGMKFASYGGEVQEKLVAARFECLSRLVAAALLTYAGDLGCLCGVDLGVQPAARCRHQLLDEGATCCRSLLSAVLT